MITAYGLIIAGYVLAGAIVAVANWWGWHHADQHRKDVERRIRGLK
jgi:hypothetical protein